MIDTQVFSGSVSWIGGEGLTLFLAEFDAARMFNPICGGEMIQFDEHIFVMGGSTTK